MIGEEKACIYICASMNITTSLCCWGHSTVQCGSQSYINNQYITKNEITFSTNNWIEHKNQNRYPQKYFELPSRQFLFTILLYLPVIYDNKKNISYDGKKFYEVRKNWRENFRRGRGRMDLRLPLNFSVSKPLHLADLIVGMDTCLRVSIYTCIYTCPSVCEHNLYRLNLSCTWI